MYDCETSGSLSWQKMVVICNNHDNYMDTCCKSFCFPPIQLMTSSVIARTWIPHHLGELCCKAL
jgi:hypothetical protein